MRESCLDCAYKHLGEAAIYADEVPLGYPGFAIRVIGSLSHAATEAYRAHPELASVIRDHRLRWRADHTHDIPYERLGTFIDVCLALPVGMPLPVVPDDCKVRL